METKYHRVYAKVDLDAIKCNVLNIRQHIQTKKDPVKIMAVIKADGYGHGAIPISRELEKLGIDYIAVAIYQEGVLLRKEGVKTPILVLGNTPETAFKELIQYELAQTIYSVKMGKQLEAIAKLMDKRVKIHIKIDTGMARLGIRAVNRTAEETLDILLPLLNQPHLEVEGLFTHFSTADEVDREYTNKQISLFDALVVAMENKGVRPEYVHSSNSAGLINYPQANYNMVRAGIALYGLYPSEDVDFPIKLTPALSIISRVVFLKTVEAGEKVSYGGIFTTTKKTKIATIPIGYADGYSRALSNKGQVVIRGQYAPVIGRVCMDMMLVDVTDIDGVCEEDEVFLIGGTETCFVTVEDLARLMQTINYEVICLIGKRVPRVYVKENEVVETVDYFK